MFYYKRTIYIYLMNIMYSYSHFHMAKQLYFFGRNEWKKGSLILFFLFIHSFEVKEWIVELFSSLLFSSLSLLLCKRSTYIYHCSFFLLQSTTGTIITFVLFFKFKHIYTLVGGDFYLNSIQDDIIIFTSIL